MAEIQAKLDAAFPSIQNTAPSKIPSGLSGSVAGFSPFNPFEGQSLVRPTQAPNNLKAMIEKAANDAGVDPALFDSLVSAESSYDPGARSSAGAMGLSQLMPGTARSLGVTNPFDPEQNLRGGATYLSQMLKRFGGDPQLALAAYNAGPNAVEKYQGIPEYKQTQDYVKKIMALYSQKTGR
jgi:soluble lytic murein transglycosylase-like protein